MIIQCEICGVGAKHTDWCPTGQALARAEKAEAERDEARRQLAEAQADADNWRRFQRDLEAGVYILEMPPADEVEP